MMRRAPPQIPVWDFADRVLGAFNDQVGKEAFQGLASVNLEEGKNLGLPDAGFDVVIVDEDAKINLNSAVRDPLTQARLAAALLGLLQSAQYDPLFEGRDPDGHFSDRQAVCGAMIDWVDFDQDQNPCDPQAAAQPNAAPEDSFYQMLDVPYKRKNAPFDSLEELHRVRGVGDDFWATFVETDPDDPAKRNFTVWGQGKINVNTANAQTIAAIICGGTKPPAKLCTDPMELLNFISLVSLIRSMTMGAPLFSSPKGFINTLAQKSDVGQMLKAIGLEPINFYSPSEAMKAISTESQVFSIVATGRVKAGKRETRSRVHAVVDLRGAPLPPQASPQMLEQLNNLGMTNVPQAPAAQLPAGADPNSAIAATFRPNPGGRIIYFRVD
jgi:general secretion pathway protein K